MTADLHWWYRQYPRRHLDATRLLSLEQLGALERIRCYQLDIEAPVPDDIDWLKHHLHTTRQRARLLRDELVAKGHLTVEPNGLSHPPSADAIGERQRTAQRKRDAARAGAQKRWATGENAENSAVSKQKKTKKNRKTSKTADEKMRISQQKQGCDQSSGNAIANKREIESERSPNPNRLGDLSATELRLTPRDSLFWNAWIEVMPDELSERARNSDQMRTTSNWPDSPGAQLRAIGGTPCRWSPQCGDVSRSSEGS